MTTGMYLTFYAGTACYVLAAVAALLYLRSANPCLISLASYFLAGGIVLFIGTFACRWLIWGHLPLTTMTDSLTLLAVMTALATLLAVWRNGVPALVCFYLPPLALLCLVNAAAAPQFLSIQPRALRSSFLTVHVGLAVLAYALFFLASMTSAAYLFQARHLKRHHTSGLFRNLPSLAELDATLFRLIRYGYPAFVITLILGLVWALIDRDHLLGKYWWLSPKVVLSYVMAGFYAGTFHMRRTGRLRGPLLAQLVFAGFFLLIISYVALSILNLRVSYFWSTPS